MEVSPDQEEVDQVEIVVMVGPEIRVDLGEEKVDLLEEVNFKGKSLTRAQQLGDLECQGKR